MYINKTFGILEDILIKILNADDNETATNNNKRKQSSINVVIPHDATQIVVNGYIKKTDNKIYVHYEVSVPQNKNTIPRCKNGLPSKLWQFLRAFVGSRFIKQVAKIYRYLLQSTFEDSIEKGLKILIAIKRIIKCANYVFRFSKQLYFDWFNIPFTPILESIDYLSIINITMRVLLRILIGILTT